MLSKEDMEHVMGNGRRNAGNDEHDFDNDDGIEIVSLNSTNLDFDDDDQEALDSEDEEFEGLLVGSGAGAGAGGANGRLRDDLEAELSSQQPLWKRGTRCMARTLYYTCTAMILLVLWTAFLILVNSLSSTLSHNQKQNAEVVEESSTTMEDWFDDDAIQQFIHDDRITTVQYQCPATVARAPNDKDDIFRYYIKDTQLHKSSSSTSSNTQESTKNTTTSTSMTQFMNMTYGAWGITPQDRKAINSRWVHWYANALTSGDIIYESACGVGLTLYVILELLQEQYSITNLEVYGNEYIPEDVVTANLLYHQLEEQQQHDQNNPLKVRRGRICHGDSTNLSSFVPANAAFDVVMTGYIDPIVDPLELHLSDHDYKTYCRSDSQRRQDLMKQEQALVEDWFALWTTEMIRIAKPNNGTIIIESISLPRCQVGDWGGVTKEWWKDTAFIKYGWDKMGIDPQSIESIDFEPTHKFAGLHDRYNIKMVKTRPSPTL